MLYLVILLVLLALFGLPLFAVLGAGSLFLSLIHISEPTRPPSTSRMPSSA